LEQKKSDPLCQRKAEDGLVNGLAKLWRRKKTTKKAHAVRGQEYKSEIPLFYNEFMKTPDSKSESKKPATEQVPESPVTKGRNALSYVAGLCWILTVSGCFVPVALENNHVIDFWGYGGPGAVLCSIVWLFLGAYVSTEVGRLAIKKGSTRGAIAASAVIVFLVVFLTVSVLLSIVTALSGRK
jgi:hypothetical protein